MGQALYRKYRSKRLDEVVGQPHITHALSNALKSGKISHAYLLTGPRGVGKTSIARILAFEVNGLPYDEAATHLDIIEIDAASNRRIDEIRDLRDKVQSAPASAKYKVYIIDEVHMLTREAFNALLKTLEEPPAHAIFILATTEAHKLPETIVSRTQRFTFKPIERQAVIDHLRTIANAEKIQISDEALGLIADHGGGSFRDSISLLDQASSHASKLETTDIQTILGIAPDTAVDELHALLSSGSPQELLNLLRSLREQGFHPAGIAKQLASAVRQELLHDVSTLPHALALQLLEKLINVPASTDPAMSLELALLDTQLQSQPQTIPVVPTKPVAKKELPPPIVKPVATKHEEVAQETVEVAKEQSLQEEPAIVHDSLDDAAWQEILTAVKKHHNTLYSVIRMAEPNLNGDELTLNFKFAFHQKRINEAKNKQTIADIVAKVMGKDISINCSVGQPKAVPKPSAKPKSEHLDTISNIFGEGEVLES